jgi:hypothetical protein
LKVYTPLTSGERTLADGRSLVPGETVDLTADESKDLHNKRLIEEGHLLEVKSKKKEDKDV